MKRNENPSRKELHDVVNWLQECFPHSFPRDAKAIKPLQLGVMDELLDFYYRLDHPPFSRKKLRLGLNYYTSSPKYLLAQKAGESRVDLYGQEVEPVTDAQSQYAKEKYGQLYGTKKTEPSAEG